MCQDVQMGKIYRKEACGVAVDGFIEQGAVQHPYGHPEPSVAVNPES